MEAAPGILRRGYEKRHRRDVVRQAPSLRTEWVGWPHSGFLHWTSHDHKWDPSGPPSTGGRNGPAARGTERIAGNCYPHPAPSTRANGTSCDSAAVIIKRDFTLIARV